MSEAINIFEVNGTLDTPGLAEEFARNRRIQIRNVLTDPTAEALRAGIAGGRYWTSP